MKKFKYTLLFALSLSVFFVTISCKKEAIEDPNTEIENNDADDNVISLEGDLQISDFIWQGLNLYYYWQKDVPALADTKISDKKAYAKYISENPDPDEFFESLLHADDRFSWIQDDYRELENTLQGIFATNGVEFTLLYACQNCDELVGVVKYILKGSNAEGKAIKRGDLFTGVNGTTLTINNYRELLFGENLSYTLNLASFQNGALVSNGVNVELTKIENFETDPIQVNAVLDTNAGKVGYLMYNQFVLDKSPLLNQVFADFKNSGITELILDLRYNGGGSIQNCIELASMITGQFTGNGFATQVWNSKLNEYFIDKYGEESLIDRFVDKLSEGSTINSLQLNRLYVLTTNESASASELLINGLTPYIDIVQIGEKTVGKNVGSITVYDYVNNSSTKNPNHNYAMQPIVLKVANSDGFADYANGLTPNKEIDEDLRNLGVLGDQSEAFIAAAINLISGTGKYVHPKAIMPRTLLVRDPLLLKRQRMIMDKDLSLNELMK